MINGFVQGQIYEKHRKEKHSSEQKIPKQKLRDFLVQEAALTSCSIDLLFIFQSAFYDLPIYRS